MKIQLRRDFASNWSIKNPVLNQGEPGFEIDTNKLKCGDGITQWNTLPYLTGEGGGSIWRVGSGVPDNSLGSNNDYYLNSLNSDVYLKALGVYSLVANIKGSPGVGVPTGGSSGQLLEKLSNTNYDTGWKSRNFSQDFSNSSTVVVNHNLGYRPSVTVIDTAGDEVEGMVTHNGINSLTIVFSASFGGTVYCT